MQRFIRGICLGAMLFVLVFGFAQGHAADLASEIAEHYLKKIPIKGVDPQLTMEQAIKVQGQFLSLIGKEFGEPVGYKAGLTNPNVQKAFGVSAPVRGTLLSKMILKSGSVIQADFGSLPMTEGDLCVRVGSEAINQAKNPEETLQHLDAVIPFIELPDLAFAKGVKFNGPALVVINAGARYGVLGDPIALSATPEWKGRLKNFTMQMIDEKDTLLGEGRGDALLSDPLNVVFWIKESLAAEGKGLKKGDLLSLGSITKMIPPKAGSTYKGRYVGLDPKGPVEISVTFK